MLDLEDWAAGLGAHYDGIRWDIDAERMSMPRERQELLNLRVQLSITLEEVAQLRASIAALEAQARTRDEDAQKRLTVANELLAASSARVSTLEGDLRAATASLEASGARVAALEVALGDAQKLLEAARTEGK
jgi:chromosome segregation ATPase